MYPIIDRTKTGEKLHFYMKLNKLTVKDVQEALGLTCVQAVYHWINGRYLPSLENLYALSELFQVPMDKLVVGSRKGRQIEWNDNLPDRLYDYFIAIQKLTA